jgi:hypothetical protein
VLWMAACLPDALVRFLPHANRALRLRLHDRPKAARQSLAAPRMEQHRVEHGAEHVVLTLVEGVVPDPNGTRPGLSRQVVAGRLGQLAPAVDPVHDLQRAVVTGLEVRNELHELVGLPVQVQPVQRPKREGRIAHPRVAVVPVTLAAPESREATS